MSVPNRSDHGRGVRVHTKPVAAWLAATLLATAPLAVISCTSKTSNNSPCYTQAQEAADAIEEGGSRTTAEYTRFADTVETFGQPFGVPFGASLSDTMEDAYERATGNSAFKNPDAGRAYRKVMEACPTATPDPKYPDDLFLHEPSDYEAKIVQCIARAVADTESKFGNATVGYSETFKKFASDSTPRDESENYPSAAATYGAVTGRSPLVDDNATAAFQLAARNCPKPP